MVVLSMSAPPVERPNFGVRQIRNKCCIFKGQRIILHEADTQKLVQVIRGPYKDCGYYYLDIKAVKNTNGGNLIQTILLGDYSVTRDDNGFWATNNWLERT